MVKFLYFCAFFLALGHFGVALAEDSSVPILRFHTVSKDIYRGARPERTGMEALAALHVRTDLDLENDDAAIAEELSDAHDLGLHLISKPMSGFWAPRDEEVKEILAIVANPSNSPIFVHCQHGQDRTGLIIGLYRVLEQGWSPADAYAEMKSIGFHPMLFLLDHYFADQTGLYQRANSPALATAAGF